MNLVRWNPYHSWNRINRELENLFDDFDFTGRRAREGAEWYPAVDLRENQDQYVLRAELPGVAKENVKVTVAEEVLTLSGEKKTEEDAREGAWHRNERVYGAFARSFRLGSPVNADAISAEYKDGVLRLAIPKTEAAKPREIKIK